MGTRAIGSAGDVGVSPSVDAQIKAVLNSDPDVVAAKSGKVGPTEGKGKKRVVMDRETGNHDRVTGGDDPPARAPRKPGRKDYSPTHTARPPGARLKESAGKRATNRAPEADKEDEFDRNLKKVLEERDEEQPYETQRGRYAGRGDVPEDEDEAEEGEEADAVGEEREPEEERDEADDDAEEVEDEEAEEEVEERPAKGKKLSLEKALRILRLEKWRTAALGKLSDEEKIQLASDRLEARSATEAKLEAQAKELAELKQSKTAAKDEAKAPASTEQVTPAPGDETFDVRKLATRLKDGFGDETVEAVSEPIMAAVAHLEKRIEAKAASFTPLIQMVVETRVAMARSRLERVYPELDSDALFDKVKKRAQKLDWDAYGGDIDAIYHDAAAIALGHRSQSDTRSAGRSARRRAQPQVGSRRTVGEPLSAHDAFGKIAAAFDAGDPELARQIHRSIA